MTSTIEATEIQFEDETLIATDAEETTMESRFCLAPCTTAGCAGVCSLEKNHVEGQHRCSNGNRWR